MIKALWDSFAEESHNYQSEEDGMRITLESDYALRILGARAVHEGRVDAKTLSDEISVTQRFTLKILHKLVQSELVRSYKGVKG